jgi:hypothetical protein
LCLIFIFKSCPAKIGAALFRGSERNLQFLQIRECQQKKFANFANPQVQEILAFILSPMLVVPIAAVTFRFSP